VFLVRQCGGDDRRNDQRSTNKRQFQIGQRNRSATGDGKDHATGNESQPDWPLQQFACCQRAYPDQPALHRRCYQRYPNQCLYNHQENLAPGTLKDQRWISIGRLDINTTGLVLFTTDGELANRLMHPSRQIDREYAVRVFGEVDDAMLERLREGVLLEDGMAKFSDIAPAGGSGMNRWFHVTLLEGRNREVRRLWESQGVRVSRLKRVRYGPIFLPSRLTLGKWEELDQKAVDTLSRTVDLAPVSIPQKTPGEQAAHDRKRRKSPGKSLQRARKGSWQVSDSAPARPQRKPRS